MKNSQVGLCVYIYIHTHTHTHTHTYIDGLYDELNKFI